MRNLVVGVCVCWLWVLAAAYAPLDPQQRLEYQTEVRVPDLELKPFELERQKFILEVLQRLDEPFSKEPRPGRAEFEDLNLQHYKTDQGFSVGNEEVLILKAYALIRANVMLGKDTEFDLLNEDQRQQLLGIYYMLRSPEDFKGFQQNVLLVRDRINKVLFVNAFVLAVRDREDTCHLFVPSLHEILPEVFYNEQTMQQLQSFERQIGFLRQRINVRPSILDILGLGRTTKALGRGIYQSPVDKSKLWMPWRQLHLNYANRNAVGQDQLRFILPIKRSSEPLSPLLEDVGFKAYVQSFLFDLAAQSERALLLERREVQSLRPSAYYSNEEEDRRRREEVPLLKTERQGSDSQASQTSSSRSLPSNSDRLLGFNRRRTAEDSGELIDLIDSQENEFDLRFGGGRNTRVTSSKIARVGLKKDTVPLRFVAATSERLLGVNARRSDDESVELRSLLEVSPERDTPVFRPRDMARRTSRVAVKSSTLLGVNRRRTAEESAELRDLVDDSEDPLASAKVGNEFVIKRYNMKNTQDREGEKRERSVDARSDRILGYNRRRLDEDSEELRDLIDEEDSPFGESSYRLSDLGSLKHERLERRQDEERTRDNGEQRSDRRQDGERERNDDRGRSDDRFRSLNQRDEEQQRNDKRQRNDESNEQNRNRYDERQRGNEREGERRFDENSQRRDDRQKHDDERVRSDNGRRSHSDHQRRDERRSRERQRNDEREANYERAEEQRKSYDEGRRSDDRREGERRDQINRYEDHQRRDERRREERQRNDERETNYEHDEGKRQRYDPHEKSNARQRTDDEEVREYARLPYHRRRFSLQRTTTPISRDSAIKESQPDRLLVTGRRRRVPRSLTSSARPTDIERLLDERQSELLLHNLQQLLARINMERFSAGLKSVEKLSSSEEAESERLAVIDRQLTAALGKALNGHDSRIEQVVGDVLIGRVGDANLFRLVRDALASRVSSSFSESQKSGVLLDDPVNQYLIQRILHLVDERRQELLGAYRRDEVEQRDIKIEYVEIDRLETFFESVTSDLLNIGESPLGVRETRLNHKVFNIDVDLLVTKPQRAILRTFLGPRVDLEGNELDLNDIRREFMLLDATVVDLEAGKNAIRRQATDLVWADRDPTRYSDLYQRVMMGIGNDKTSPRPRDSKLSEPVGQTCRFPRRLLLPRGHPQGLPMQLLFIVNNVEAPQQLFPIEEVDKVLRRACGMGVGASLLDSRPLGFPLDRPIEDVEQFIGLLNVQLVDINIYHQPQGI